MARPVRFFVPLSEKKTIKPRINKFGARDDLEERYGMGVNSGSESSKVKATLLESVRALVMPIKSALYLHSVDGATVCRIVANISHYSFII